MNRRALLANIPHAGAAAAIFATGIADAVPLPQSAGVLAAIQTHRLAILRDETLFSEDGIPLVDASALANSDAGIYRAWLSLMEVPCASMADVHAKVDYVLNGTVGERTPLVDDITGPDGSWTFDPAGPLMLFLRSLTLEAQS